MNNPSPAYLDAAQDADRCTRRADYLTRHHGSSPLTVRAHRTAADAHLAAVEFSADPTAKASHREAVLRHWEDANHLAAARARLRNSIERSGESFLRYLGITPLGR